jgi:ABC-type multidrug transport system fused ATPase/permease subunit
MVVSEEIEALEAQAIDPVRFLVVPRFLATTIMMVCIAVVGDLAGGLGGLVTSKFFFGISSGPCTSITLQCPELKDFITGLIKAGVFGALISAPGLPAGPRRHRRRAGRRRCDHAHRRPHHRRPDFRRSHLHRGLLLTWDGESVPDAVIQVIDATKIYDGRTVLDAIRLDVFRGETLVILGGSGSGKSTLLRMMIGNVPCDGGDIEAFGKSLTKMTPREMDDYRRSVGVLFQSGALFNSMTVADNVALPLREHTESARRNHRNHGEDQAGTGRPAPACRQECPRCSPAE